nr:CFF_HP1_G0040690.mRNA.1.CDS.1 [Saccharomyces cerevisiae]
MASCEHANSATLFRVEVTILVGENLWKEGMGGFGNGTNGNHPKRPPPPPPKTKRVGVHLKSLLVEQQRDTQQISLS